MAERAGGPEHPVRPVGRPHRPWARPRPNPHHACVPGEPLGYHTPEEVTR